MPSAPPTPSRLRRSILLHQPPPFKVAYTIKLHESREPVKANSSGSQNRFVQLSPTSAKVILPLRVVDGDHDEGMTATLIGLASHRRVPEQPAFYSGNTSGPALPPSRPQQPSMASHWGSISSTRSRNTPPVFTPADSKKWSLSLTAQDKPENKRTNREAPTQCALLPMLSSRPSPAPFRTQPPSHLHPSEMPQNADKLKHPYPSSSQLPAVLPPVPLFLGAGFSLHGALSPTAALLPTSNTTSQPREPERGSNKNGQSHSNLPAVPTLRGEPVVWPVTSDSFPTT